MVPKTARVAQATGDEDLIKSNAEYTALLSKLSDIPTLPMVAMKVNELINNPNSTSAQIADVLKKDQVLVAKILKLVNSSYYSIPGGVTDVQRALAFLGFNTLAQLVLSLSIFTVFKGVASSEFSMLDFWKHALGTAVCSELLAKRLKIGKPEEAFTCGLLHDIGKLVLGEIDAKRLAEIVREAGQSKRSFAEVEKQHDLPGHSYLGEVIATQWGLPQMIRLCIRYHHVDVSRMDSILASAKPMIAVVRLANQICIKNQIGKSGDCSTGEITPDMLAPLGLTAEQIPQIEAELKIQIEKAGAFVHAYK